MMIDINQFLTPFANPASGSLQLTGIKNKANIENL